MGHGDDTDGIDPGQTASTRPEAAESAGLAGWLRALNSFLERAFLEADRATGC